MLKPLCVSTILCVAFCFQPAFAQKKQTPPVVAATTKPFKVVYGSAPWNRDSTQLDQAYMFVRDKNSNRTVKILIEETEPDSSIFSGNFAIDFKSEKPSDIEVYVPPENVRASENAVFKFNQLLNEKKIAPSPTVFKDEAGSFLLDVYDTPEQAKRARKVYEDQVKNELEAKRTKNIKPVPKEQALEAAQMAETAQIFARIAKEAADRESARIRLEQLEAQRLEQMRKDLDRKSAAEKKKLKNEADQWAEKGNIAYDKGEFKSAEVAYAKSVELDPNNKETYFKYGVSLYRNTKMNDALVALKLSPSNPDTDLEKRYYMGLIHYRLNEFASAINDFSAVRSVENPLSVSAGFYEGVVYFAEENYDASQKSFEWVLDVSQDPSLDKKSEEYIERIAAALAAKKEAARKWKIDASVGVGYDSNILFSPDNDTTNATTKDEGGLRTSLSGSADYRLMYSAFREWSVKASTYYMYSLDKAFVTADPFLNTVVSPYIFKGTLSQRGYTLTLTPGYDKLFMDAENTGTRENIYNSMYGIADFTVVMRDNWFASYIFEARKDAFDLTSSAGDDNLDSLKLTLKTQHVHLLDEAKKQAMILQAGLIINDATGKNKTYQRIDLGLIYSAPWKRYKDTTWNMGVAGYKLDYPDDTSSRADTDLGFTLGMNKIINPRWNWGLTSNYTNNASTVDANQYSKYSLTYNLNYAWTD